MEDLFRTFSFISPAGYQYTIREQNGADEDILSNPVDAKDLTNLTKFISSIVVNTDFTSYGKLTLQDVDRLPLNDRYSIIFHSRIFSLGEEVEFEYDWGNQGGVVNYSQNLKEFIFDDYSKIPTDEELESKPHAIPYYPMTKKLTDYIVTLSSGKVVSFDLMNGLQERMLIKLPVEKQTRNSSLLARNLKLQVEGNFEKVTSFAIFTPKDMVELRKEILAMDPIFDGNTDIEHPSLGLKEKFPIMLTQTFFFLTEA